MNLAALVRKMAAAGASPEVIALAVEAVEAEGAKFEAEASIRRAKAAERTRKHRAKASCDVTVISHDVTVMNGDGAEDARLTCECAQVVIPSLPSLRSEEVGGGGGGTREPVPQIDDWPTGNGQQLAKILVEAAGTGWLDPTKSPDLTTTLGRLAAWKRDGASWEHDVVPVVSGLCANRRSRISSWKFFDQAIARSIADNRAALEIPEAGRGPTRATRPPRTIDEKSSASWDYAMAKIAHDDQSQN